MGKINVGRVLLGGLLAGLIINIGEFILNEPILGQEWATTMQSLNRPVVGGGAMGVFVVMGFILGIGTVWTYAAIRPRMSPGPKTAVCAGLLAWFFAYFYPSAFFVATDLFPTKLIAISLVWGLVELPVAAVAGAWPYKEA